jgi:hypothetical protein
MFRVSLINALSEIECGWRALKSSLLLWLMHSNMERVSGCICFSASWYCDRTVEGATSPIGAG